MIRRSFIISPLTPFKCFVRNAGNGGHLPKFATSRNYRRWAPTFVGMIGLTLMACSQNTSTGIVAKPSIEIAFAETSQEFTDKIGLRVGQSRAISEPIILDAIRPKSPFESKQFINTRFSEISDTQYILTAYTSNIANSDIKLRWISALFEVDQNGEHVLLRHGSYHICANSEWNERTTEKC